MAVSTTSRIGEQAIDIMNNRERMEGLPRIEPGVGVHFIGVGGIGVSALASLCLERGARVTGTDRGENDRTLDLAKRGARIEIGESPSLVEGSDFIVYSTAVPKEHGERRKADELGIPEIRRGTLLAHFVRDYKLLGVAGTHGKTTTSSMMALATRSAGLDPTLVIGGYLSQIGGNAWLGTDEYCVAETDESDGSFLELDPHLAIVTNVEDDHLDHYGNIVALRNAFADYLLSVEDPSKRIVCADCPDLLALAKRELSGSFVSYGFSEWSDIRGVELRFDRQGSSCQVLHKGASMGELRVRVPGRHMLSNALSVYAAGISLGLPLEKVAYGLSEYTGTRRRFEILGQWRGATLIDDYAHHPTEIRATLQACRQFTEGRCVAVFQPHRYSRTDQLFAEFAKTFSGADLLIVTDIYAAGEEPRSGVNSKSLSAHIEGVGRKIYAPSLEDVGDRLREELREGDTVLFLGAGNVNATAFALLEEGD